MSATEEDTELRDLLIQNLENNGVVNKIKAELRAAVFLALEEQDKVENKTPLVNESLKKFLNSKDGRLVASLITDFLQVFNLDFTLAVFQPETNTLNGLDGREAVSRELGLLESEGTRHSPLLLELVKRSKHKEKSIMISEELSPRQIAEAKRKFDFCDKDRRGWISREELRAVLSDLFPTFNKNMLETYISDEIRAIDKYTSIDFQELLGMYKRFFIQCRNVVTHDASDAIQTPSRFSEEKTSKGVEKSQGDSILSFGSQKGKGHVPARPSEGSRESKPAAPPQSMELEEGEGDSFFDDPLPKPQKTYGGLVSEEKTNSGASLSEKSNSQKDLSALGSDTDGEGDDLFSDKGQVDPDRRRLEAGKAAGGNLASLSDAPPLKSSGGVHSGDPFQGDRSANRNGTDKGLKDFKTKNDKIGSPLFDEDLDYDDDFNSHRSDMSKSELSIGEDIEEVSIEGPDNSDKLDELTQDLSVSQLSQEADYMENVS